jgi:hypothetical protein
MIAPSRRSAHGPLVIRHYEFSRLQDRSVASAYEALIPVFSRPLERPRGGRDDLREALTRTGPAQSSAEGA